MPIVVENVSYTYAPGTAFETAALSGVSLTVEDGEFIGIMGRTGCGKTTLIQLMAGLLRPSSGRILLDGKDINAKGYRRDELREKVGLLFQFPECQLFETTVERDVAFGLKYLPLSAGEKEERVRWALEAAGFSFESIRNQSPLGLSGGEKRRVAIAGVLAAKPRILILDEPVASLDSVGRRDFMKQIRRLHRNGTTIIMISHDADILGEYAQRILVLDKGKLRLAAPVKEIFKDIARMEALNLDVSRPRKIAHMLLKKGISFPQDITGYGELLGAIKKLKEGCLIS
jgi:energy-coupling factor transport system ATP-binding protein